MHPLWRQKKIREFCGERKIHVSAYSPLGGPGSSWGSKAVVEHPTIRAIALKHNATPAQVKVLILSWIFFLLDFRCAFRRFWTCVCNLMFTETIQCAHSFIVPGNPVQGWETCPCRSISETEMWK